MFHWAGQAGQDKHCLTRALRCNVVHWLGQHVNTEINISCYVPEVASYEVYNACTILASLTLQGNRKHCGEKCNCGLI